MNNKLIIKIIFTQGFKKVGSKGLKSIEFETSSGSPVDFVFGNNKILGKFAGNFMQFTDYAWGGTKVSNYKFYKEDGTPLTENSYSEWQIIHILEVKEKFKKLMEGEGKEIILAKDVEDRLWYFIFPNGEKIEEDYVWLEE